MAKQLLLVRHGTVGELYVGTYVGRTDLPLSLEGRRTVEPLAEWLAGRKIGRAWCSPKLRARQTADIIAARRPSLSFAFDDNLREVDFGQWELMAFPQIAAEYPGQVARWVEAGDDFVFPGGERIGDFRARVAAAATGLAADPADIVLAVCHAGVIREMICHLLGLNGPRGATSGVFSDAHLFKVRNATCSTIDLFDGKGVLAGLNLPSPGVWEGT